MEIGFLTAGRMHLEQLFILKGDFLILGKLIGREFYRYLQVM